MDTADDASSRVSEFFGIDDDDTPTCRLINLETDMKKYVPEFKGVGTDDVRTFVNDYLEGKLKVSLLGFSLSMGGLSSGVQVCVEYLCLPHSGVCVCVFKTSLFNQLSKLAGPLLVDHCSSVESQCYALWFWSHIYTGGVTQKEKKTRQSHVLVGIFNWGITCMCGFWAPFGDNGQQ